MAGTIRLSTTLQITNGEVNLPRISRTGEQLVQTNAGFVYESQTVPIAAHAAINYGNLTTPGRYLIINPVEADDAIQIGLDVAAAFQVVDEIPPGEWSTGRIGPSVVLFWIVDPAVSAATAQEAVVAIAED